jgi:hypothetical protein
VLTATSQGSSAAAAKTKSTDKGNYRKLIALSFETLFLPVEILPNLNNRQNTQQYLGCANYLLFRNSLGLETNGRYSERRLRVDSF